MNANAWTPSPELMTPADTALLIVDVQTKLVGLVPNNETIVWNIGRLITGAELLGVTVLASEQYPKGLGSTAPEISGRLGIIPDKVTFSCLGCDAIRESLAKLKIRNVLVAGIESHVCVQQTAIDLLAAGYRTFIAADAIGARGALDHQIALRRLEVSGAVLTTTEAALFEWCRTAAAPEFKQLSALIKAAGPK